jgi:hypothetical protein
MRMRSLPKSLSAVVLAVLLASAPDQAAAQGNEPAALHRSLDEFARLRADLDRINAEVVELKRSVQSVRNDYRLRDRMADAEALAQKVTQAEAHLRDLGWTGSPGAHTFVAPPPALPQDGSVELEAKAGLFADQAKKLDGEATMLARAANELRSRKALRQRAAAWDRDPFSGLETSKRSLAISSSAQKAVLPGSTNGDSATRGGAGSLPTSAQGPSSGATTPTLSGPQVSTPGSASPPPAGADTALKGPTPLVGPETAAAAKNSPLSQTAGLDRQTFEQRLYLDPATAAELRHVLGSAGATSDPDALERAAAMLRARARALNAQAQALLAQSRTP